jgi:hypothetical protein
MSLLSSACVGSAGEDTNDTASTAVSVAPVDAQDVAGPDRWVPRASDSWQWQLEGDLNTTYDVDVYDIDLFDAPAETIRAIQSNGAHVICYFSAGSWEEWRDDAGDIDASAIGRTLDGWEDERWLDITHPSVSAVMAARLDLAVEKGCDGVEPDNVSGHGNDTGFDLGRTDQITYNRWLAEQAHRRELSIGLKNSLDLVADLVDDFDFSINEECWEYDECAQLVPFVAAGKAVFNAEYAERFVDHPDSVCDRAIDKGFRTLILPLDLDDTFRISCDGR